MSNSAVMDAQAYLRQLAPHIKEREAARIISRLLEEIERLTRERDEARNENVLLRGLVQTAPDWKCTYGNQIPDMAHCPSGFPGCSCADDLMCAQDEAYGRMQQRASLAASIALEQAAKVCERNVSWENSEYSTGAIACAKAIRSLKPADVEQVLMDCPSHNRLDAAIDAALNAKGEKV